MELASLLQEIGQIINDAMGRENRSNSFKNLFEFIRNEEHRELHFFKESQNFLQLDQFIKDNHGQFRRDVLFMSPEAEKTSYKFIKQICELLHLKIKKTEPKGKSTDARNRLFKRLKTFGTAQEKKFQLNKHITQKLNQGKSLTLDEEKYMRGGLTHYVITKEKYMPRVMVDSIDDLELLQWAV